MDMNTIENVVKLAIDRAHNSVMQYTPAQADKALHEALVEANNGKTYLDWKDMRDGKCVGLYTIMEQILQKTVVDGLDGNEFFNALVEHKTIAMGDKHEFIIEGSDLFTVSDAAAGTQGIRRQRLTGSKKVSIDTVWKVVKIYEEMNRILAGDVDFNKMIAKVGESYQKKLLDDIFTLFNAVTKDDLGGDTYVQAGSFSDDAMLDLIEHVEAKAGTSAVIRTTKKGARKLITSEKSNMANDDLYKMGYYGNYYGTPIIVTPQRHQVGTDTFMFDDNRIDVIAAPGKPIKQVMEGSPIINMDNPMTNPDMVQNYFFAQKVGTGFALNTGAMGRYEIK